MRSSPCTTWGVLLGIMLFFALAGLLLNHLLYQARLVPRWLAVWGLIGIALLLIEGSLEAFATNGLLTCCRQGLTWSSVVSEGGLELHRPSLVADLGLHDAVVGDLGAGYPAAELGVAVAEVAFDPASVGGERAQVVAVGDDDTALTVAFVHGLGEGVADALHDSFTQWSSLSWIQRILDSW